MQYQIQIYFCAPVIRPQWEPESFLPNREGLEKREERGPAVIEKLIEPYREKDIDGFMALYRREGRIGGKA